jgi:hypothetical protein
VGAAYETPFWLMRALCIDFKMQHVWRLLTTSCVVHAASLMDTAVTQLLRQLQLFM